MTATAGHAPEARTPTARAAVTLVFALSGALFGGFASRMPAIKERLDLADGELALALATMATGALLAMPLAGAWAARVGSLRATRTAAVAFVIAVPLIGLAPALGLLMGATLLTGMAAGSLDVSMNAHGVAVEKDVGRPVLSSMHAAFSIGGLVGAGVGALCAGADLDVRVQLPVFSVAGALVVAAAWRPLARAQSRDESERPPFVARPSGALWGLGAIAFVCLLAEGAAADWSAVYVREDLGAGAATAGAAYAAFSLTMAAGRLVGDRLVGAFGATRVVRWGSLAAGAGLGAALLVAEPPAALVGFALMGAGLASVVPVVFRAAGTSEEVPAARGIAAVSTLGYAGFLAGPPLVGGVAELVSLPAALGVVAVLLVGIAMQAGRTG